MPPIRIPYHRLDLDDRELRALEAVLKSGFAGGGGPWLSRCEDALRHRLGGATVRVVTSCTHALEMAMMLLRVGPGDEVIVPAFTFSSTATCVLRQGARVVFADVREDDLNVDPDDVARRVGPRTRAVIAVHYGGAAADVDRLRERLPASVAVVEDAAHALDSRYKGRACGTLGWAGCLSFHGSKNLGCGEGGALVLSDDELVRRADLLREIGTDRALARRGDVDEYSWWDVGSSFIPSELQTAVLAVQLEKADGILAARRARYRRYAELLADLERRERLRLPRVAADRDVNGHVFHVLLADEIERERVRRRLLDQGIQALSHYLSLDATPFGRTLLEPGDAPCPRSRDVAGRILRLPLFATMTDAEQDEVVDALAAALRTS